MVEYVFHAGKTPENGEFNRVHAFLVTDDQRVLLRYKNSEARVTGGRLEPNEELVPALEREILEELNCKIDRCDYLGYISINRKEYDESIGVESELMDGEMYWARMVARVSEILPARADPDRAGNWIYGRTLAPIDIAHEEMDETFPTNREVLDRALKIAREQEYFTKLPNMEYEVINVESHNDDARSDN